MKGPRSLLLRLALALGVAVTLLWLAAAAIMAKQLQREMEVVFDAALRDTAHRMLPLVMHGRRPPGPGRGWGQGRGRGRGWGGRRWQEEARPGDGSPPPDIEDSLPEARDNYRYAIFDEAREVIAISDGVDPSFFPPFEREGFFEAKGYKFFYDRTRRRDVYIVMAEPLSRRAAVAREMAMGLSWPLLAVIPLSILAIFFVVRGSLTPVRKLRDDLGDRDARHLSPVADHGLPSELTPIVGSINALFARLKAAFEAERSFAANAAHELRTPVAGAIAQAQRLKAETKDESAAARAGEIETTLKRLNSLSEKLMQLARAEGARLRTDTASDMRPILKMIVQDFERCNAAGRLDLTMADDPVLSDLDPDAFGILARNLVENALKHGAADAPVTVSLIAPGRLTVANAGAVIPPDELTRLTARFARSAGTVDGSGLGLAIVRTICERAAATLDLRSPATGRTDGVEVSVTLPHGR
ncbi:sensor histidine kinase [Rhodobium gokarnense]|uniref:histidine kinase n=1 Tax=Rhodobium gokarnense TaxID=364296 RepID=A0ABT3H8M2_9HYPH|nr:HAMP domain-containing sensor histidine kinase [Rhodobium gokarnense]MCW2306676.1 two-component system OmpR family sensor kinase [Rhodobium gokarnense]